MNFDYNLSYLIPKDLIRTANNTLISRADEMWVFGEISDGVLMEIYFARKYRLPIRYFRLAHDGSHMEETAFEDVVLEDVSEWMWEWIQTGKQLERWHPRLRFHKTYPLVYPAYSKRNFYWQMHISQFCLEKKYIPLNPFMLFRYFLGDSVSRDSVYAANNSIVRICDELWTFGEVSDGVLAEIKLKKSLEHPVKYFKITQTNPVKFRKVSSRSMEFEDAGLETFRTLL